MPRASGAVSAKLKRTGPAKGRSAGSAAVIGLDIGSSAVRAVEVCTDRKHGHHEGRPVVRVFGQIPLPPGAVVDGEVADPALVGTAIRALWQQLGLRTKDVRVGLASQRVVVRVIELPPMPDDELEAAARFMAGDHIPIPLDEAVLDVSVLEQSMAGDAAPMVRVLLAAAHRETLDRLLEAADIGGVRVVGVDLTPLALVRALRRPQPSGPVAGAHADEAEGHGPGFTGGAAMPVEAIVSVGAAVTSVVVHEGGRPCFVRTVATGGQALTAGLADELGLELHEAEAVKVGDPSADPDLVARAARTLEARIGAIVGEIHGSLSYWMAQSDQSLDRVLLTGGSAAAGNLPDRLGLMLGVPVEVIDPAAHLDFELESDAAPAGPGLAVAAAGLAMGAVRRTGGPLLDRPIDLLPTRPAGTGLTMPNRKVLAGVGVVLLLIAGLSVKSFIGVAQEKSKLASAKSEGQKLQAELAELSDVRQLRTALQSGRSQVADVLTGDIDWPGFMEDFAERLPDGTWISSFNGERTPAGPSVDGGPPLGPGTVNFTASGRTFPSVSDWLDAFNQSPALSGVSVGSMTKGGSEGSAVVNFSSNASIAPAAESNRAQDLLEAPSAGEEVAK